MQQHITFAAWPLTRAVKILLIINAAIWMMTLVLTKIAGTSFVYEYLALTPSAVYRDFHVWQLFTYMWLHDIRGISHILFNCLFLWMFGGNLEQSWGIKKFITFYVICGIGAGFVVAVSGFIFNPSAIVVGASGAIYGLVAAWAAANPDRLIFLFGVLPVKARYFILFPIGYAFLDLLVEGSGVSHSAHLGGLAIGVLYATGYWHPGLLKDRLVYLFLKHKLKTLERRKKAPRPRDPSRKKPPDGGYWH